MHRPGFLAVNIAILERSGYKVSMYCINSGVWHASSRPRLFIVAQIHGDDPLGQLVDSIAGMPMRTIGQDIRWKTWI